MSVKLNSFPLWTPVHFQFFTPPSYPVRVALRLGSWADRYAHFGSDQLNVKVELSKRFTYRPHIEKADQLKSYGLLDLKIISFVLSLFIAPTVAFGIKCLYKLFLNHYLFRPYFERYKHNNKFLAANQIGKTRIVLLKGTITNAKIDAIVNAANEELKAGGGICGAIRQAGGSQPFKECEAILKREKKSSLAVGKAVLTSSGRLAVNTPYIVHAVGPIWNAKQKKKCDRQLERAYTSTLQLAAQPNQHLSSVSPKLGEQKMTPIRTIALCSISTGLFGFPVERGTKIALATIKKFVEQNPSAFKEIHFVFLPKQDDPANTASVFAKQLAKL